MRSVLFFICIFIAISFTQNNKSPERIINCIIVEAIEDFRNVRCGEGNQIRYSIFPVAEWPEEWKDSTKVGDIVKIKSSKEMWIAFPSCEARRKQMEEKLAERKTEFKLPLQLPIDKDCQ